MNDDLQPQAVQAEPTLRRGSGAVEVLGILLPTVGMLATVSCMPGEPPELCPTCTIELEAVITIGPNELFLNYSNLVRTSTGRYVVGPIAQPGAFALFDGDGTLLSITARPGEGPGELPSGFRQLFAWQGDSVAVPLGMRVMILAADGSGQRTMGLPGIVSDLATSPSGAYARLKPLGPPFDAAGPVVRLAADGEIVSSFGADVDDETSLRIAATVAGPVFVHRDRLHLVRYTGDDAVAKRMYIEMPFLRPMRIPSGERRPGGYLTDVSVRGDTAWVRAIRNKPERYQPVSDDASARESRARPLSTAERLGSFVPTVLLVDMRSGGLITRREFPDRLLAGFADADHVYSMDDAPNGDLVLTIWRTSVRKEGGTTR